MRDEARRGGEEGPGARPAWDGRGRTDVKQARAIPFCEPRHAAMLSTSMLSNEACGHRFAAGLRLHLVRPRVETFPRRFGVSFRLCSVSRLGYAFSVLENDRTMSERDFGTAQLLGWTWGSDLWAPGRHRIDDANRPEPASNISSISQHPPKRPPQAHSTTMPSTTPSSSKSTKTNPTATSTTSTASPPNSPLHTPPKKTTT